MCFFSMCLGWKKSNTLDRNVRYGPEIAKNLILSGVCSINHKDHANVSISDFSPQFLIPYVNKERNVSID